MRNNKGFSLVELIVVIAIMAVLAAVAVIGVSIYIPKAQKAADDELLNVLTDALVAACMSEGVDQREITATIAVDQQTGKLAMNGTDIAIQISGTSKADEIADLFNDVVTDKNAKFNIIKNKCVKFVDGKFDWSDGTNSVYDGLVFDQKDIDKIKDSNFGGLGAEVLLGRVDLATDLLSALAGEGDARVDAMLMSEDNMKALAKSLNLSYGTDEFDAKLNELTEKKMEMLKKQDQYSGMDDDTLRSVAAYEIFANNAVLVAATQPKYDQDAFVVSMANGTAKSVILGNLENDPNTAISQAALVYGMYTSYAAMKNIEVTDEFNIRVVLDAMDDNSAGGFQEYMRDQATADLEAYNASMNMINTGATNPKAVEDVLLNGFNNDGLTDIMGEAFQ